MVTYTSHEKQLWSSFCVCTSGGIKKKKKQSNGSGDTFLFFFVFWFWKLRATRRPMLFVPAAQ